MGQTQDTLYVYRAEQIPLKEALRQWLAALGVEKATAIAYGRDSCLLAMVTRDGDLWHPENTLDPYELRAFTDASELRWVRIPAEQDAGKAAVLFEGALDMRAPWQGDEIAIAGRICQQYLVWGEGTGESAPNGWSKIGEARIGALLVPLPDVGLGKRVVLRTVEYLRVDSEHGNTFVYDERLRCLECLP